MDLKIITLVALIGSVGHILVDLYYFFKYNIMDGFEFFDMIDYHASALINMFFSASLALFFYYLYMYLDKKDKQKQNNM